MYKTLYRTQEIQKCIKQCTVLEDVSLIEVNKRYVREKRHSKEGCAMYQVHSTNNGFIRKRRLI